MVSKSQQEQYEINTELLSQNPLELKGKERDNWLKEKTKDMMGKVRDYEKNPEDVLKLLQFMSQFHTYSLNNLMLIQEQWAGAYAVASFKKWKSLGINVKEKGKILVWVRTKYRLILPKGGEPILWSKAPKQVQERAKDKDNKDYELIDKVTYKAGFVFDISQTDAKEEDIPKLLPNRHYNLEVDEETYHNLLGGIDAIARSLDHEMNWDETDSLGNAKGCCYRDRNEILLNPRNTPSENLTVSIHELAHAHLHKNTELSKPTKELQAELVSALVCNIFGIGELDHAVDYIARWTKNGERVENLDEVLKEVQNTVKKFAWMINNEIDKNKKAQAQQEEDEE